MPKAGILTFHDSYNYGACLQAYATLRLFEELGYDSELVNYVNSYEQRDKGWAYAFDKSLFSMGKTLVKNIVFKKDQCLRRSFEGDSRIYDVSLNSSVVADVVNAGYDLLVSGSDQLWNPEITGGIDRSYYLDFDFSGRKISFASSAGSHIYSEAELREISQLLSSFDAVTVREQHLKKQIESVYAGSIRVVPDPTLMFDGIYWRHFSEGASFESWVGRPYVLSYFVGKGFEGYRNKISKAIDCADLPIWNIQFNTCRRFGADRAIVGASIRDFVALINNASLVLTDSFHGVAFSINMNKPFVAFNNPVNPRRVQELLEKCDMSRYLEPTAFCINERFDFGYANKVLDEDRASTRLYLSSIV